MPPGAAQRPVAAIAAAEPTSAPEIEARRLISLPIAVAVSRNSQPRSIDQPRQQSRQ